MRAERLPASVRNLFSTALHRSSLIAVCAFGLAGAFPRAVSATPSLVAILPPATFSRFLDPVLSGDGTTVVGTWRRYNQDPFEAEYRSYVWTREDGLRTLDQLGPDAPDYTQFVTSGVSGDGSRIVGSIDDEHFVWQRGVGTIALPGLPAGTSGVRAVGISDDGRYVVGSAHDGGTWEQVGTAPGGGVYVIENPRHVPVRWDLEEGSVTALSTLRGIALDVSDDGIAVGELQVEIPGIVPIAAAFRWDPIHGDQQVPTGWSELFLGFNDDVTAISADGTTLVGRNRDDAPEGYWSPYVERAYSWSGDPGSGELLPAEGLSMIDSPIVPNDLNRVQAVGVSADGSTIVGNYGGSASLRPFVWTQEAGFQDLKVLLATFGISSDSWLSFTATGVSADGKTIVGSGFYRNPAGGSLFATWVAVIPEPSTALLLGLGLSMLGVASRQGARKP